LIAGRGSVSSSEPDCGPPERGSVGTPQAATSKSNVAGTRTDVIGAPRPTDDFGNPPTPRLGIQMFDWTGRMGGVIARPGDKPVISVAFAGAGRAYLCVCAGDSVFWRKTKAQEPV
jgi:hypothetical protein